MRRVVFFCWSISGLLFRNSTISARCISKSSKHSSGTFGLWKSIFNSFKSSQLEGFFVFYGKYVIGISWKPSDILSTTCKSSISFFSSAVVVLLLFGESPLMTSTYIFKKLEFLYAGASDSQIILISLQHRVIAIIRLHSIKIFFQS